MCPQACTAQTLGLPGLLVFWTSLCVTLGENESTWPVESDPSIQSMMSTERHLAVTAGHPNRKWNMRDSWVSCCVHLSEGPLGKWLGAAVTHSRHLWDVGNPPICASQQLIIRSSSLYTPAQMEMCREQEQKGKRGAPGVKHTGTVLHDFSSPFYTVALVLVGSQGKQLQLSLFSNHAVYHSLESHSWPVLNQEDSQSVLCRSRSTGSCSLQPPPLASSPFLGPRAHLGIWLLKEQILLSFLTI